jgi:glycosyltransferase involved in cell wall biosynthesis
MLVSIIIPNYNHAKYLTERIESIINQTYKNIEIIILDDNSQDDSLTIIGKYCQYPKVAHVICNKKNSGALFKQWWKGIQLAKGDYIWIAESDDYSNPTFIDQCLNMFNSNSNLSMVFCNSTIVEDNVITNNYTNDIKFISDCYPGNDIIDYWILKNNGLRPVNASSVIFKNNKIFTVNSKLFQKFKYSGDKYFWYSLLLDNQIAYISEPLNFYRRHRESATSVIYGNIKKNDRFLKIL